MDWKKIEQISEAKDYEECENCGEDELEQVLQYYVFQDYYGFCSVECFLEFCENYLDENSYLDFDITGCPEDLLRTWVKNNKDRIKELLGNMAERDEKIPSADTLLGFALETLTAH